MLCEKHFNITRSTGNIYTGMDITLAWYVQCLPCIKTSWLINVHSPQIHAMIFYIQPNNNILYKL